MAKWLKTSLKIIASLVMILILLVVAAFLFISFRKDRILKLVNTELNKNIDGTFVIGDMHPQFFKGFPDMSLGLDNVLLRDKRFAQHHHTLLDAKNFDVSVNTSALLKGVIAINHIAISNATIDLYTDNTGYSNTTLFKKGAKKKADTTATDTSDTQLKKFSLTNVNFKVDDQKAKKLFDFVVNDLHGDMAYPDTGWQAKFHLDVQAKSMAFSTTHGSFIKNKALEGDFVAGMNKKTGRIAVNTDELDIGDDPFKINAVFETGKPEPTFLFHIACKELLWRSASALLAQNIKLKLDQFNMSKPIDVTAIISGSFSGGGDPYLYITAGVKDNTISIPGSEIDDCSFDGIFTNSYQKGKELGDPNSVIRLINLKGNYHGLPFRIDTGSIIDLVNPIATGNFKANFPLSKINSLIDARTARVSSGTANINLRYRGDIVNYQINKPIVTGRVDLKNADINYVASGLFFKNTSLSLNFVGDDLILNNIRVQTGRSIMMMDGRVNNFLNLYYNSPEKILLKWNIRSPQMYLAEFIGFLDAKGSSQSTVRTKNSGNIIKQFSTVLHKGNAQMRLSVANAHYNKFLATDVKAELLTTDNGVIIQNIGLKTSGGSLQLKGNVKRSAGLNSFSLNTTISNVNVRDFFYAFDNFGLKDFGYENLRGSLSARTQITGNINNKAALLPHSLAGTLNINLKNGALLNFKPLLGVGKYAFPFRDLKNIRLPSLDAQFTIQGDMIQISPMQISSSVLNADVEGVYSTSKGTNIALDIPLRNPKGDSTITDKAQLQKRRFRGIVLHLLAKDDETTGKIKIGLNKNHKDTSN